MTEEWCVIPSYPCFEASSFGNIRRVRGGRESRLRRPKRRHVTNKGYLAVGLGNGKKVQVHQLVAEAFLGPARGLHVNHKNGLKTDCRISNLEYVTKLDNERHAQELGLSPWGDRNGRAKLANAQIAEIKRRSRSGEVCKELAREFCVSESHVRNLRNGNRAERV